MRFAEVDPEEKKQERTEKLLMTLTMVVSFALAIGIFMVLPYFLSDLLMKWYEENPIGLPPGKYQES